MSSLAFLSDGRKESIDRVPDARRNNAVKRRIIEKEARQGAKGRNESAEKVSKAHKHDRILADDPKIQGIGK
jgi:hypothetical protein